MPPNRNKPPGSPTDSDDPFGPGHYTRDWDLLVGVAREWADLQGRFGFGDRAPRDRIEAVWDEIFRPGAYPHIRRLGEHMANDDRLRGHLSWCYWNELKPKERRGHTCEELVEEARLRLIWTVVRNAARWLPLRHGRPPLQHWARFWNTDNLTEELRRAACDLDPGDGGSGELQPAPGPDGGGGWDPPQDGTGRQVGGPAETAELYERAASRLAGRELEAFRDWWGHLLRGEDPDEDAVARRHGLTPDDLTAAIRTVLR